MQRTVSAILRYTLICCAGLTAGCAVMHEPRLAPPKPRPLSTAVADSILDDLSRHRHTELSKQLAYLGEFVPSFYQIVDEAEFPLADDDALPAVLDRHGETIAYVPAEFHRRLNVEGCGRLRDGRVLTYDTRIDGEIRFKFTDAPYGLASRNMPLAPFRSVAVDTLRVPLGTLLYIPAAAGMELPDGSRHDGVFLAKDVGSAIVENRIDVFVGFEDHIVNRLTVNDHLKHGRPVRVYRIDGALAATLSERFRHAQETLVP